MSSSFCTSWYLCLVVYTPFWYFAIIYNGVNKKFLWDRDIIVSAIIWNNCLFYPVNFILVISSSATSIRFWILHLNCWRVFWLLPARFRHHCIWLQVAGNMKEGIFYTMYYYIIIHLTVHSDNWQDKWQNSENAAISHLDLHTPFLEQWHDSHLLWLCQIVGGSVVKDGD